MIGGVNIKYINSTLNNMQHEVYIYIYIYMLENSQANNTTIRVLLFTYAGKKWVSLKIAKNKLELSIDTVMVFYAV